MTWSVPVRTARGDLMRARHRLSKLLLRQGIVYSGGQAWTGAHDAWLRRQRFDSAGTADDLRVRLRRRLDGEGTPGPARHRDRGHGRRLGVHRDGARLGCLRGVCTLTGFALAVEIGDWHRFTGNTIGSFVGLVPSEYSSGAAGSRARSPRPATATRADCWSRPPGTTAPATAPGKTMRDRWELASPPHAPAAMRATGAARPLGEFRAAASGP